MSIQVSNKTELGLKVNDHYVCDPKKKVGYDGALEYEILAGGKKSIPSAVFTEKLMDQWQHQEIHVKSGDKILLVLHHDQFQNNKGKELLLEMADGCLQYAFVDRTGGTTLAQRIWGMFPFRGTGAYAKAGFDLA